VIPAEKSVQSASPMTRALGLVLAGRPVPLGLLCEVAEDEGPEALLRLSATAARHRRG
jgi:hypothetical protein